MHAKFDGPNITEKKKKGELEHLFANSNETYLTVPKSPILNTQVNEDS